MPRCRRRQCRSLTTAGSRGSMCRQLIRTLVEPGERIRIRATVLTAASIDDDVTVTLRQRPMGETSQAAQTNLTMVQVTAGRGVFEADLEALTEPFRTPDDGLRSLSRRDAALAVAELCAR